MPAPPQQPDQGGAHPLKVRAGVGFLVDCRIGDSHCAREVIIGRKRGAQRGEGMATGDLAAGMSAHSIRHDYELGAAGQGLDQHCILILAPAPPIGEERTAPVERQIFHHRERNRKTTSPISTWSLSFNTCSFSSAGSGCPFNTTGLVDDKFVICQRPPSKRMRACNRLTVGLSTWICE